MRRLRALLLLLSLLLVIAANAAPLPSLVRPASGVGVASAGSKVVFYGGIEYVAHSFVHTRY